jgi:hypothetical protein
MISIYWAKHTYCEEKHRSYSFTSEELGLGGNAEKGSIYSCVINKLQDTVTTKK